MKLLNDFEVGAPIAQVWSTLVDVERIAPCFPGAQLQEAEGDEYRGVVKVKLGPITAEFKGVARISEQDDVARRATIEGSGKGSQGQASAVIIVQAMPVDQRTKVHVETNVILSGRVAQFGRSGIMAEVSGKIISQFADNLSRMLERDGSQDVVTTISPHPVVSGEETAAAASSGTRKIASSEAEAIDLVAVAGGSLLPKWLQSTVARISSLLAAVRLKNTSK